MSRSVWSAWSLLPLWMSHDVRQREQAPRTPDASRGWRALRLSNRISIMEAINETLIRDVVAEVLGRLDRSPAAKATTSCACAAHSPSGNGHYSRGKHGVFEDANEACAAAQAGFLVLKQKGVAARV